MENKEVEYAKIDDSSDKEIQDKLNSAKIQYPVWKGETKGQTISGYVKEVLTFKDLNGSNKHGVLLNLQTKSEEYPIVSVWANTVILSGLKRISELQNFMSFEAMTESLKTIEGKLIALRYEGEEKSSQKGFKNYQNYTIVEV